jgi:endonuclease YncB( thermonuclease family)
MMSGNSLAISSVVASLLLGCGPPTGPSRQVGNSATRTAPSLILSPSVLNEAFLIGKHAPIRWRFVDNEFVVESWERPLPQSLLDAALLEAGGVYRLGGHWQLLDDGHRLRLYDLQADGPGVKPFADVMVDSGPGESLIVGGVACTLMNHPDNPEILPDDSFRARLNAVREGHLIDLQHDGTIETLRLGGIVSPAADQPVGRQAVERADQLMRGKRLQVKVYDSPPRQPRHAHVFTSDLVWVNLQLVEEGLAWHDKPNDHEWLFSTREDMARQAQLGIWSDGHLTPPWWTPAR